MTANDSNVSDGDILTGSQVVRVYGQNLASPFVTLAFGDVEYTPLAQGEDYIEFVLGSNGVATISVDGSPFMSFEIEGIVVPSILPAHFRAYQKNDTTTSLSADTVINRFDIYDADCVNYPWIVDEEYPYFFILVFSIEVLSTDFGFYNCTLNDYRFASSSNRLNVSVIDPNEVAYITYQGFIIAVFNYTTD